MILSQILNDFFNWVLSEKPSFQQINQKAPITQNEILRWVIGQSLMQSSDYLVTHMTDLPVEFCQWVSPGVVVKDHIIAERFPQLWQHFAFALLDAIEKVPASITTAL